MTSPETMLKEIDLMIANLNDFGQTASAAVLEQAKAELKRLPGVEADLANALNVNASLNKEILNGLSLFRHMEYEAVLQAIATADPSVFPPKHDPAEWVLAFQQLAQAALDGQAPYQVIRVQVTDAMQDRLSDMKIKLSDEQVIMPKWAMEYLLGNDGYSALVTRQIKQAYLQANGREAPHD